MRILTEPKNAITRQFQKFLQLDKVELHFTPGAIEAAAELALNRKTGARALRSIVEESLLEVMFDIPERTDVRKCIITEETIRPGRAPLLLTKAEIERGVDETNYAELLERTARLGCACAAPASASAGDPDATAVRSAIRWRPRARGRLASCSVESASELAAPALRDR